MGTIRTTPRRPVLPTPTRWLTPLLISLLCSCAGPDPGADSFDEDGAKPATPSPAPTIEELANARYDGLTEQTVTLVDGEWQGEPVAEDAASRPMIGLVEDFHVVLDADGDGNEEAIALLWSSSGGSGTFDYLALMGRDNDQIVNLGTADLGDRVSIRSYDVEQGRLVLEVVQAGPRDARCCPGEVVRRSWAWIDNRFSELPSEPLGRLSLAHLEGVEWILERLTWKEPVASEPAITLIVQDQNISGTAGCNRFQANVDPGDMPGDLAVGPVAATSRSCGDTIDALESRFLEALSGVNRYSFMAGKLVLSWSHGDQWNTMVFAPRPLATPSNS